MTRLLVLTFMCMAVTACARTMDRAPADAVDLARAEASIHPDSERVYPASDAADLFAATGPALRSIGYTIEATDASNGFIQAQRVEQMNAAGEVLKTALVAVLKGGNAPPPSAEVEVTAYLVFQPFEDGLLKIRQRIELQRKSDEGKVAFAAQIPSGKTFEDVFDAIEALSGVEPLAVPGEGREEGEQ